MIKKSSTSKRKTGIVSKIIIPSIITTLLIIITINMTQQYYKSSNENIIVKISSQILNFLLREKEIFRSPLNVPPTFDPASLPNINQLYEDSNYYFDLNATDPDNDTLIYSDDTSLFNIDPISGVIDFTPSNLQAGNFTGDNSVALLVKDPSETGDVFFWGFTINSVNDLPVLEDLNNKIIRANVRFSMIVNATDEEDDPFGLKNGNLTFFDDTNLFVINRCN